MKLYVDYDSTLNNLDQVWLRWVNAEHGTTYTTNDLIKWNFLGEVLGTGVYRHFCDPAFYDEIVPHEDSQWFVNTLRNMFGTENVLILTSSPEGIKEKKNKHISYYYGFPKDKIIHSKTKHEHTKDGILIDDNKELIISHTTTNNNMGILFDRNGEYGWNKLTESEHNSLIHVKQSYDEIIELLSKLI